MKKNKFTRLCSLVGEDSVLPESTKKELLNNAESIVSGEYKGKFKKFLDTPVERTPQISGLKSLRHQMQDDEHIYYQVVYNQRKPVIFNTEQDAIEYLRASICVAHEEQNNFDIDDWLDWLENDPDNIAPYEGTTPNIEDMNKPNEWIPVYDYLNGLIEKEAECPTNSIDLWVDIRDFIFLYN